jgi:hypothetical protein
LILAAQPPFLGEFPFFLAARFLQSSRPNELNDALEFGAVEPGAVSFADVYNYLGRAGKAHAIHQLGAFRTGHITHAHISLGQCSFLRFGQDDFQFSF